MTTTLTITSGQTHFIAQGYDIIPSPGTAVPDNLVATIQQAAQLANVVLSSSAGTGTVIVGARRFVSTGTGAPTSGSWLLGDEVVDSTGAEFECTAAGSPGTWVAVSGGGGAVASVAGKTGTVTLVKGDVGLGNVDNTSDVNKPVSTAQATADALALAKASNLSDLASAATARTNLGLGTAATQASSVFAGALAPTAVKTANYTAAAGDFVPFDLTSGSLTLTLPTAPTDGTRIATKIVTQPGTNTVTINCGGSDVINKAGTTSGTISLLNQSVQLQYKASGAIWYVAAADLPLSQLDSRYQLAVQAQQTGTSYTLVLADGGTVVESSNSSAVTFTVPPNSSVAFPVGTSVVVRQYGAGAVTVAQGAGVTLHSRGSALKTAGQYAEISMTKRATDEWIVSGDLTT